MWSTIISYFQEMTNRSSLKFWLKLLVGMGLFLFLICQFNLRDVAQNVKSVDLTWLSFSFLMANALVIAMAIRQTCLFKRGNLSISESVRLQFKATFASNFLPSGVGADAYKTFYLRSNGYSLVLASKWVFIDRFSGMLFTTLIGLIALSYDPLVISLRLDLPPTLLQMGCVLISAFIFSCMVMSSKWLFLQGVLQGYRQFLQLILVNVAVFSIQLLKFYALCQMLYVDISFLELAQLLLIFQFAALIPFTVGGLGVVEGALVALFVMFDVSEGIAIVIALMNRATVVQVSLIGAYIWTLVDEKRKTSQNKSGVFF